MQVRGRIIGRGGGEVAGAGDGVLEVEKPVALTDRGGWGHFAKLPNRGAGDGGKRGDHEGKSEGHRVAAQHPS